MTAQTHVVGRPRLDMARRPIMVINQVAFGSTCTYAESVEYTPCGLLLHDARSEEDERREDPAMPERCDMLFPAPAGTHLYVIATETL